MMAITTSNSINVKARAVFIEPGKLELTPFNTHSAGCQSLF
jgi:hypothetical protein